MEANELTRSPSIAASALLTFTAALGALPLSWRRRLGRAIGRFISWLPSRERSVARLQISRFLCAQNAAEVAAQSFEHAGLQLLESLNLRPLIEHRKSMIVCEDWEEIQAKLALKRGIVALTAHTGNWDLVGAYMVAEGLSVATIARPARSRAVQHAMASMRNAYGISSIWRTGKASARPILQTLQGNGIVAALIDQDTDVKSVLVPFFGVPCSTPAGIVELGRRAHALVCSVFSRQLPDGKYLIKVQFFSEGLAEDALLNEFNMRLEAWIRECPEQWVWFHKRWRTLPSGERLSTARYLRHLNDLAPAR